MRLKKLKLFGFKSFADRTVIDFVDGITAIVGPNGCGKSNISDAIRWVLGEQSAKSMRGSGKMTDVIFAGTHKRNPLNFSEVSMVLCNEEGTLPIEYDEVEITRKLHRSGESEYFINRNPVRLKDIHALFVDSGIGKNAYAIFEQGKIEEIIQSSPKERRRIFEDAAGIVRFLQRKEETLRKLEGVDQNLHRVNDLRGELEKQINVLGKQAEKAKTYKDNERKLKRLEQSSIVRKYEQLTSDLEKWDKDLSDTGGQAFSLQGLENVFLDYQKEMRKAIAQTNEMLQRGKERVYKFQSHQKIKIHEEKTHREKVSELGEREKKLVEGLRELKKEIDEQTRYHERAVKDLEKLGKKHAEEKEALTKYEKQLSEAEKQSTEQRSELEVLRQKSMQGVEDLSSVKAQLGEHAGRMESRRIRFDEVQKQAEDLTELVKSHKIREKERKDSLESLSRQVEQSKKKLSEMDQKLDKAQVDERGIRAAIDEKQKELSLVQTRHKVLCRLKEDMEGLAKDTQKLLVAYKRGDLKVKGGIKPLAEYVKPSQGYEELVAKVLRPYSQTMVIENPDDLDVIISFAKEKKIKDFSVFCPKWSNGGSNTSALKATTLSWINEAFFAGVGEVESIGGVFKGSGAASVKGGPLLDQRGVLFFTGGEENSLFLRESEIKSLEKQEQTLQSSLAREDEKLTEVTQIKNALKKTYQEEEQAYRKMEMRLVEVNFQFQQARQDLEKGKEDLEKLDKEKKFIQEAQKELKAEAQELEKKKNELEKLSEKGKKEEEGISEKLAKLEEKVGILKQKYQDQRTLFEEVDQSYQALVKQLEVAQVKQEEGLKSEKKILQELEEARVLQKNLQTQTGGESDSLKEIQQNLKQAESDCHKFDREKQRLRKELDRIDHNLESIAKKRKQLEEHSHSADLRKAQIVSKIEDVEKEFGSKWQKTYQELSEGDIDRKISLEEAEKEIKRLRRWVQEAGDINMTSIDAFKEQREKFEFLTGQVTDLTTSKKELLQIIEELDKKSRDLFKETFETIRESFQRNFQILFNGGEADLRLIGESRDPLEAGIDIIAKPPGKKMRSISLLSGGEKCLTAMALLFSVFEVKPAPFCVLDEIDAPLDDSNVVRFANMVKQFVSTCQFIVITHNKRTMAIADTLFGVSMQEKGVSKILSLKFSEESVKSAQLVGAGS